MNKATTKDLPSSEVCSLFEGLQRIKVNEAINNGEKFARIVLHSCSCRSLDYKVESMLTSVIYENYNHASRGNFVAKVGTKEYIVSYKIQEAIQKKKHYNMLLFY